MERKISFVENEYYHLYNRGVDKRTIFSSSSDYRRFMMLLYLANTAQEMRIGNVLKATKYEDVFNRDRGAPLVAIGAFCLMPNHFHLLVTPLVEGGVSKYMLKLQTGYSMYFNTKNERSGSLFQGPFRSTHADTDRYLEYLFSYIHLNPAKLKEPEWQKKIHPGNNLMSFVETYPYSSYSAYLNNSHSITDPTKFPDYFSSKKDVVSHIADWLTKPEDENE
ncbi:MAG: transposase [Candidatus Paceibacterota bacterium]|jgi:putative transposase